MGDLVTDPGDAGALLVGVLPLQRVRLLRHACAPLRTRLGFLRPSLLQLRFPFLPLLGALLLEPRQKKPLTVRTINSMTKCVQQVVRIRYGLWNKCKST